MWLANGAVALEGKGAGQEKVRNGRWLSPKGGRVALGDFVAATVAAVLTCRAPDGAIASC